MPESALTGCSGSQYLGENYDFPMTLSGRLRDAAPWYSAGLGLSLGTELSSSCVSHTHSGLTVSALGVFGVSSS